MTARPSAIPVGTQFSPDLVSLPAFLEALVKHGGDKAALMDAVWAPRVRIKATAKKPTKRQRSLPLEAAVQYGLLSPKTYEATDLARELAKLAEPGVYDEFAKHILIRLGGVRVVEAAQQMKLDSLKITGDSLARYLTEQGFHVVEHNTAINSLRMWLAKSGVFGATNWDVNASRKRVTVKPLEAQRRERHVGLQGTGPRLSRVSSLRLAQGNTLQRSLIDRSVGESWLSEASFSPEASGEGNAIISQNGDSL